MFYFNDSLAYVFLHSQEFHKIGVFTVNLLDIKNFFLELSDLLYNCWERKSILFKNGS